MMRRPWLLGAAVVLGALDLAAVACSSFTTSPDDAVDPADAGGEDAGLVPDGTGPLEDAAPATADTSTNLLTNADFELPGCVGWHVGGGAGTPGTLRSVPNGRDGGSACLVCGTGNGPFDVYQRLTGLVLAPDDTYLGSAYIRAPDAGKTAQTMQCAFIAYAADGGQQRQPNPSQMTASYELATCAIIVARDRKELEFSIASMKDGVGCFLVDDARVHRKP